MATLFNAHLTSPITAPEVAVLMILANGSVLCAAAQTQLFVKAVTVAGRRYIICRNDTEAAKDAAARAAILGGLDQQLKRGDKALIGNSAYRRFLRGSTAHRGWAATEVRTWLPRWYGRGDGGHAGATQQGIDRAADGTVGQFQTADPETLQTGRTTGTHGDGRKPGLISRAWAPARHVLFCG
jgi:hypothetical protein